MRENSIGEFVFIVFVLIFFFAFRAWQANGDTRCFFARDPATCATVRIVNNQ